MNTLVVHAHLLSLERWDAVKDMLDNTDRRAPDVVLVDHEIDELRLVWEREQAEIVVAAG